MRIYIIQCV